ncbi:MAG: hypothetical protein RL660_416 [Bacteroidota bacterium]
MKKIGLIMCALCTLYASQVTAQSSVKIAELRQEVKKEKLRIHSLAELQQRQQNDKQQTSEDAQRKTRAIDKRFSTASNNEEGEAYIAINPNNTQQIAVGYMDNLPSFTAPIEYRLYYTSNGGSTWTQSTFGTGAQFANDFPGYFLGGGGDPVLEYDKDGKLHFSWIYLGLLFNMQTGNVDSTVAVMYHATSTNNGQTFSLAAGEDKFIAKCFLDANTFESIPGSDGFHDRQWFAVDHSNSASANAVYCSFIYFNTPSEPLTETSSGIRKLNNGASAFGARKKVVEGSIQFNNVRVDKNGKLHITGANVDANEVVYCTSSDGGQTFSAPTTIYTGTNLFGNQGNSYYHDRENAAVNLALDGSNKAHLVWTDFPSQTGPNVKSYYSNNASGSFSTPVDLETLFQTTRAVLMPTICAADNRMTIGAYIADRTSKMTNYYVIHSANAGQNWSNPVLVSADSFDFDATTNATKWFGDYYNAVRTASKVYNVWSDGRGSNGPKMYIGITDDWPTAVTEVSPLNGTSTMSSIFPQPSSTTASVKITSQEPATFKYQICDLSGKVVATNTINVNAGDNTVDIAVSALAAGNYVVNFANNHGERFVRKLQRH